MANQIHVWCTAHVWLNLPMCKCMWLSLTLFISSKACTTNSSAAFLDCLCRAWAVTFVIFGHVNRSRYLLTNAIYAALMRTLVHMITCVQPSSLHGPPDSLQLSQLPTSIPVLTCLLNAGRKLLMTQITQPHESRPHCKLVPIDLAESCSMRMAGDQRDYEIMTLFSWCVYQMITKLRQLWCTWLQAQSVCCIRQCL